MNAAKQKAFNRFESAMSQAENRTTGIQQSDVADVLTNLWEALDALADYVYDDQPTQAELKHACKAGRAEYDAQRAARSETRADGCTCPPDYSSATKPCPVHPGVCL